MPNQDLFDPTLITSMLVYAAGSSGEDTRRAFLSELEAMVRLGKHPNIISLLGISETSGTIFSSTCLYHIDFTKRPLHD